jgi:crotonobetainyl-CoA:carnitine CoA-transferase CaiB-like acyl-CoA transferase
MISHSKCKACRQPADCGDYCRSCKRLVHRCIGCGEVRVTTQFQNRGRYCEECWDVCPDLVRGVVPVGGHSGPFNNDPGFDNVVRAMEEDR